MCPGVFCPDVFHGNILLAFIGSPPHAEINESQRPEDLITDKMWQSLVKQSGGLSLAGDLLDSHLLWMLWIPTLSRRLD